MYFFIFCFFLGCLMVENTSFCSAARIEFSEVLEDVLVTFHKLLNQMIFMRYKLCSILLYTIPYYCIL